MNVMPQAGKGFGVGFNRDDCCAGQLSGCPYGEYPDISSGIDDSP